MRVLYKQIAFVLCDELRLHSSNTKPRLSGSTEPMSQDLVCQTRRTIWGRADSALIQGLSLTSALAFRWKTNGNKSTLSLETIIQSLSATREKMSSAQNVSGPVWAWQDVFRSQVPGWMFVFDLSWVCPLLCKWGYGEKSRRISCRYRIQNSQALECGKYYVNIGGQITFSVWSVVFWYKIKIWILWI